MTASDWLGLIIQASIMLTVFGLGLTANRSHATYLFRHPKLLLRAVLSMSIIMPIVAAIGALLLDLRPQVEVALVALSMSPVPPIIQKKEIAAGGRLEYVVGLLVAMSLLAIVLVPLTVLVLDHIFDRDAVLLPVRVAKALLLTVLLPLAAGMLLRHRRPALEKMSGTIMTVAGLLLLVPVVILIYKLWPVVVPLLGNGTLLMILALILIGMAVGHALGGPIEGDRTALAISTASRHPAIALLVATSGAMTDTRPELSVILLYLVIATVISLPYQAWRARVAKASRQHAAAAAAHH